MKTIKYLIAAFFLAMFAAFFFKVGRNYEEKNFGEKSEYFKNIKKECQKHYEVACLEADFIRYLIDHFDGETECANIGMEIEECYYEYFTDIENFKTHIKSPKEFDNYYWCY
jgi:hypothetical protein